MTPIHFCKVLIAPGLVFLPISTLFRPYLHQVSDTITLKTSIGCTWDINVRDINGRACLDQGWPAFAIAHNLKIGYFLTFKKLTAKVYKVVIFDYYCSGVMRGALTTQKLSRGMSMRSECHGLVLMMLMDLEL